MRVRFIGWEALLVGFALLAVTAKSSSAGWDDNRCVTCHETERLPISLGHSFEEWRASEHARSGVGCEKCHGGNAAAKDMTAAHAGVLPAADPKSMVNPIHIPATCGACHSNELKAYSSTVHAKQVAKNGEGATCFTCHGSMATSLPSPSELNTRCAVCHKKPVQAKMALAMLASTRIKLQRTGRTVEKTRSSDPEWYADAHRRLLDLERKYRDLGPAWHTFNVDLVIEQTHALQKLALLLDEEVSVRSRLKSQP
jgi:hypothetical protein